MAGSLPENGMMTLRVMVQLFGRTEELNMRENGKISDHMAMALCIIPMVQDMKESGKMGKGVMEHSILRMVPRIKESGKTTILKAMGFILFQMEKS